MSDSPIAPSDGARSKPRAGCWFLLIPILAIPVVIGLYVQLLAHGLTGRAADGDLVQMRFKGCSEAAPVLEARLQMMGLPEVQVQPLDGTITVSARLPADASVAQGIPETLSTPGRFAILSRGSHTPIATHKDLVDAGVRLDLSATPRTFVKLDLEPAQRLRKAMEENPEGGIVVLLDGIPVYERANLPSIGDGDIELLVEGQDDKTTMERAAARGVVLRHGPLPCPVSLIDTEVLSPGNPSR